MAVVQKKFFLNADGSVFRQGLVWTPADYDTNQEPCALMIFFHGAGDAGYNGTEKLNSLYSNGSPLYWAVNKNNPMIFKHPVTGKSSRFIIVAVQGLIPPGELEGWCLYPNEMDFIMKNDLLKNYRVNLNQVFCVGLSAGGQSVHYSLSTPGIMDVYACGIALSAAAPLLKAGLSAMKTKRIRVWGFHGDLDGRCPWNNTNNSANDYNAVAPNWYRFTSIGAGHYLEQFGCRGHAGWSAEMNPDYKETIQLTDGKSYQVNHYEWCLLMAKDSVAEPLPPPPPPPAVKANAGADRVVASKDVVLDCSQSINVSSAWWEIVSRPTGAGNPLADGGRYDVAVTNGVPAVKTFSQCADGIWVWRLHVKNKYSQEDTDDVQITIASNAPTINLPPVVGIWALGTIQLPVDHVILDGSTSVDPDGRIVSYLWQVVSGPGTPVIAAPTSVSSNVTGLTQPGTYVFKHTITDDKGATASGTATVTVLAAPPPQKEIASIDIIFSDGSHAIFP
jgi:hypothetical protein